MPSDREQVLNDLQQRWRAIFGALAGGGEVPPTQRLRTEGMMETLVMLNFYTEQELQAEMAACYRDCYGAPLENGWQEWFPFPQIPGFGTRAPVYPSTSL